MDEGMIIATKRCAGYTPGALDLSDLRLVKLPGNIDPDLGFDALLDIL